MNTAEGPLTGKTILVTRPIEQAEPLLTLIKKEGGNPLPFPVVTITETASSYYMNDLSRFSWIIFTSKNGVDYFFKMLKDGNKSLKNHKFAAVGEKTAHALQEWGISSIQFPERYDAPALVALLKQNVRTGEKLLFPKGNLAPSFIKRELEGYAEVEERIVYETRPTENLDWNLMKKADGYFFLSPSAVSFMMQGYVHEMKSSILEVPAFCIGPSTKKAALDAGFRHVLMPECYTAEAMVKMARSYYHQGGS
ncbi:uroporphyrinogen-III synthase [Fictibacillus nanhaiensis]|uniref:uroporphyrinogen-III synthase n=1 Tax=Fictibacillus nanhaiensis TaxID=742169 RepID=UPI001C958D94|nr:uroporphyrinogen-III synthase [Fictibacillus nanhaiensis]MBY6035301.1 uroporphyrinogen-III synthase [Fictibacillus nanhaiensis]